MTEPSSEARAGLLARASSCLEDLRVPGAVIGIHQGDETNITPYGVTSVETGFPVLPGSIFQIGSITKPFVATLVMTLVDDELVDLDTPVIHYVPDLKLADAEALRSITVRQLLIHTSGFWGDWFADFGLGDDAIEQFVARYHDLEQITKPGELWAYNNCGYILAGLIATRVTEKTFEEALNERVLEPLEVTATALSAAEAISHPLAVGHLYDAESDAAKVAHQYRRPRCRNPAGGIVASVADVLKFARLHLGHEPKLLSTGALAEMHGPQVETFESGVSWGLGFSIEQRSGTTVIGHGGATNGFRASLSIVPEHDFALVILTNSDRGATAASAITDLILEGWLGLELPAPDIIELAPDQLQRFTGRYCQPYNTIEVELADANLQARWINASPYSEEGESSPGPWYSLQPMSSDEFVITEGDLKGNHVRFWFGENGAVRFLQSGGRLHRPLESTGSQEGPA